MSDSLMGLAGFLLFFEMNHFSVDILVMAGGSNENGAHDLADNFSVLPIPLQSLNLRDKGRTYLRKRQYECALQRMHL